MFKYITIILYVKIRNNIKKTHNKSKIHRKTIYVTNNKKKYGNISKAWLI